MWWLNCSLESIFFMRLHSFQLDVSVSSTFKIRCWKKPVADSYPEKDSTGTEGYTYTLSPRGKGNTLFFLIKKEKKKAIKGFLQQNDFSLNWLLYPRFNFLYINVHRNLFIITQTRKILIAHHQSIQRINKL